MLADIAITKIHIKILDELFFFFFLAIVITSIYSYYTKLFIKLKEHNIINW